MRPPAVFTPSTPYSHEKQPITHQKILVCKKIAQTYADLLIEWRVKRTSAREVFVGDEHVN